MIFLFCVPCQTARNHKHFYIPLMSDKFEERWNCVWHWTLPDLLWLSKNERKKLRTRNQITSDWCSTFSVSLIRKLLSPKNSRKKFTLSDDATFVIAACNALRLRIRPLFPEILEELLGLPVCWKRQHLRWRNLMSIHRRRRRQVRGVYKSQVRISRILMPIVERVDVCKCKKKLKKLRLVKMTH